MNLREKERERKREKERERKKERQLLENLVVVNALVFIFQAWRTELARGRKKNKDKKTQKREEDTMTMSRY